MKSKVLGVLARRASVLRAVLLCALCVALLCGCGPAPDETSSVPSVSMYAPVDVAGTLSISGKQLYLIKNQWPLRTVDIDDFGTLYIIGISVTTHGVTYLSLSFTKKASLDELYDQYSAFIDGTWEISDSYFSVRDGKAEGVSLQCSVNHYETTSDVGECDVSLIFPFEEGNRVLDVILEAHWPGEPFEVPELEGMACSKSITVMFSDNGGYREGSIFVSGSWQLADESDTSRAYQAIVDRMAATEGFVRDDVYEIVDGKEVLDPNGTSFKVGNTTVQVLNGGGSISVFYDGYFEEYWSVTGG